MKELEYKIADIEQLADVFLSNAMNGKMSVAVLPYKETVELIAALLKERDVSTKLIDIADEDIDDYNKEYTISLDDELWLFAERAWGSVERGCSRDGYLTSVGDYMFITEGSYDDILPYCKGDLATYKLLLETDEQEDVEYEETVGTILRERGSSVTCDVCDDSAEMFKNLLGMFFNNRF